MVREQSVLEIRAVPLRRLLQHRQGVEVEIMIHTGRAVVATVAMEAAAAETTPMRRLAVILVLLEEVHRADMEEGVCQVGREGWVACLVDQG